MMVVNPGREMCWAVEDDDDDAVEAVEVGQRRSETWGMLGRDSGYHLTSA